MKLRQLRKRERVNLGNGNASIVGTKTIKIIVNIKIITNLADKH